MFHLSTFLMSIRLIIHLSKKMIPILQKNVLLIIKQLINTRPFENKILSNLTRKHMDSYVRMIPLKS